MTRLILYSLLSAFVIPMFGAPARSWGDDSAVSKQSSGLKRTPIPAKEGFGEGWKQTIRTKPGDDPCDVYDLWVTDGWLYVRRTDEHGDLDWQIKLAEAERAGIPSISIVGDGKAFQVSSEDGGYFIRETAYFIRAIRQPDSESGALAKSAVFGDDAEPGGWGQSHTKQITLSGWKANDWFYVASGPEPERFNCVVRLNPVAEAKNGYGVQVTLGELLYMFHGETHLWDDGELLVAARTLRAPHEQELARRKVVESLAGNEAPKIDAAEWFNTDVRKLDELKGKVVLLDFWATWCGPCVAKLPDVQKLADKFADQGLVVIGIHSESGGTECGDYVKKNNITFPVVIDDGATAERYGINGIPAYYLIDKSGKVVEGFSGKVPDEQLILKLLKQEPEGDAERTDAEDALQEALSTAKADGKNVFVHLGSPSCGWCRVLETFLAAHSELFEDDYVVVKIDIEAMERGATVADRLRKDRDGGIPWIVILNAEGEELITSDGPDGNIGCPVKPAEIDHFMTMIEKTSGPSAKELGRLRSVLEEHAAPFQERFNARAAVRAGSEPVNDK